VTFPVRPGAAYPDPGCGPVYDDADLDCWVITRAEDMEKTALDTKVFSARTTLGSRTRSFESRPRYSRTGCRTAVPVDDELRSA
jgi:hypothetical protein